MKTDMTLTSRNQTIELVLQLKIDCDSFNDITSIAAQVNF